MKIKISGSLKFSDEKFYFQNLKNKFEPNVFEKLKQICVFFLFF